MVISHIKKPDDWWQLQNNIIFSHFESVVNRVVNFRVVNRNDEEAQKQYFPACYPWYRFWTKLPSTRKPSTQVQSVLNPSVQFHIRQPIAIPKHVETPQYEEEISRS